MRLLIAGWICGCVTALSQAWWWGDIYLALSMLLIGVVLTLTAYTAVKSDTEPS
jgi:hypothetical protein